jgi:hypothetical protein
MSRLEFLNESEREVIGRLEEEFWVLCLHGHLNLVKRYYRANPLLVYSDVIFGADHFTKVCARGDVDMADWFYEMNDNELDDCTALQDAFLGACVNGHVGIVEWCIETFGQDISPDWYKQTFYYACKAGHLEVAQLIDEQVIIGEGIFRQSLIVARQNGHNDIAKWIFDEVH